MTKKIVFAKGAPQPIGPYSQAVVARERLVFTAGQIGIIPKTGEFAGGDVKTQTRQVLENLKSVLEAAGSGLNKIVKTTVYLHDMADFPTVNEIYGKALGSARPARSTVQASALPRGALVEIDMIAAKR